MTSATGKEIHMEINFCETDFRGCRFCYISRGFIFADGKILVISRGLF